MSLVGPEPFATARVARENHVRRVRCERIPGNAEQAETVAVGARADQNPIAVGKVGPLPASLPILILRMRDPEPAFHLAGGSLDLEALGPLDHEQMVVIGRHVSRFVALFHSGAGGTGILPLPQEESVVGIVGFY